LRLLSAEGSGLSLTVTGDYAAIADRNPAEDRAWAAIAYRARIMGGTARVAWDEQSRLRSVVSLPLESFDSPDAKAPG